MRPTVLALLLVLALPSVALCKVAEPHGGAVSAAVQKALNDPARQTDDRYRSDSA